MPRTSKQIAGTEGELEVVKLVECPNCTKELMLLPKNYPLCDLQCTACQFRVQIKTNNTKPKEVIRGAGWNIMEKVLKAGFLVPPLMVNFKWKEKAADRQEIRFYPFIRKRNLTKYIANIKSKNRLHPMFNYNLKGLKYYILYQK